MDNLAAVIGGLSQQVVALTTLMSLVFTYFHRSNIITDEEYRENMGQFTANISLGSSHLVDYLIQGTNPLSSDEAHRLKELVDRAGRGEIFLRPEVREYKTLIAKVKRDHPYDPRVWQLVTLGTLMSGVYLNEPEEEPE